MPKIVCHAPFYDFGAMENTGSVEHAFVIWNEGQAPLQIGQIRACCGASATISDKIIPPGTSATFRVVFSLAGRIGTQQKSLYIASNDPSVPYLQLRLIGTAVEALEIHPRSVDFGTLEQNTTSNTEITIRCTPNLSLNITNVLPSAGFMAAFGKTGKTWKVNVTPSMSLPLGTTKGSVTILTDNREHSRVEIPLCATLAGDIVAVPAEIPIVETVPKNTPITRYVSFRSRAGRPFRILDATPPDPAMKIEQMKLASGGYRITIGNVIPAEKLNGKDFVVTTDNPLMPRIAIPFVFYHPMDVATNCDTRGAQ